MSVAGAARPRIVLVLGGTAEAASLAAVLDASPAVRVISSLAGATRSPAPLAGERRSGGFGGAPGLARYLRDQAVDAVVDATHPFAARISANAVTACEATGRPLVRLVRPPWRPGRGDRWREVDELSGAAALLPSLGRRVFLATGLREVEPFVPLVDHWFLLRAVDRPARRPALVNHHVVVARGPFDEASERALLDAYSVEVLVTRNAGGDASSAKLAAARSVGVPVVMVRRPSLAPAVEVQGVDAAVAWIEATLP